jgi:hypothetical protein
MIQYGDFRLPERPQVTTEEKHVVRCGLTDGERTQQDQPKMDRCLLGCVHNFATRETIKSKEEVQVKDQKVQAKIIEIKEMKKDPSEEAETCQSAKKQTLDVQDF